MVHAYAVDHLCFRVAHLDVRKGNEPVWQFHERFGAKKTDDTELDYFYELDSETISASRQRYSRFWKVASAWSQHDHRKMQDYRTSQDS